MVAGGVWIRKWFKRLLNVLGKIKAMVSAPRLMLCLIKVLARVLLSPNGGLVTLYG